MSTLIELKVPDIGGHSNVDVIEVAVKVGDEISEGQVVAIVEVGAAEAAPAPKAAAPAAAAPAAAATAPAPAKVEAPAELARPAARLGAAPTGAAALPVPDQALHAAVTTHDSPLLAVLHPPLGVNVASAVLEMVSAGQ